MLARRTEQFKGDPEQTGTDITKSKFEIASLCHVNVNDGSQGHILQLQQTHLTYKLKGCSFVIQIWIIFNV